MKTDGNDDKKLTALLKRLKKDYQWEPPPEQTPVSRLVLSFLQWGSTTRRAVQAYNRLMEIMVDHNDLRVSHTHEVVEILGRGYPQAERRAGMMRQALQEIYLRERAVTLEGLTNKSKKQVRAYLETLPGIVPYVTARVTLLSFGGHAIPVDENLTHLLNDQGVLADDLSIEKTQSYLERRIKANNAVETHMLFQAWTDAGSGKSRSRVKTKKKASEGSATPPAPNPKQKKSVKNSTDDEKGVKKTTKSAAKK